LAALDKGIFYFPEIHNVDKAKAWIFGMISKKTPVMFARYGGCGPRRRHVGKFRSNDQILLQNIATDVH